MSVLKHPNAAFQLNIWAFTGIQTGISTQDISSKIVRVPRNHSFWVQELENRLNHLVALEPGWDGYGGKPVSIKVAQFSANLLEQLYVDKVPAPQLVPGSDGSMQIEWHVNQYDLEVDVMAPYDVVATLDDRQSGKEEEIEIENDYTILAGWVRLLGQDRSIGQQEVG